MIYEIKRNGVLFFSHAINGVRVQSSPAVDFIDINFDYKRAILFQRNDTIEFLGKTFYCDKQYNNELKEGLNIYKNTARFYNENFRLTEIALLEASEKHVFEIEGNLLTLLTLAVSNLNRVSSGWSYNTDVPNTVTKLFSISDENVMSFLTRVSGEFEIPFDIKNKVISFRDTLTPFGGSYRYGKGRGFLDLRKYYRTGEKIANTLYAKGRDNFTLAEPVINQPDININGVIEGFYTNERVFPTTRGQMNGSVTANNVVVSDLVYNINDYRIGSQLPIINFETGALAGLSFFVNQVDYVNGVSVVYIKRRTELGVLVPNDNLRPLNGDIFNITNITQPTEVLVQASDNLQSYALSYLNERILRNLVIEASVDPLVEDDIEINSSINISDSNLGIDGFFIVNEIRQYLQDLQRKEISLDYTGRQVYQYQLETVNTNIIELGIDNNRDDIVQVEESVKKFVRDIDKIQTEVDDLKLEQATLANGIVKLVTDVDKIQVEKVDNINRVGDLNSSNPLDFPNVIAVNDALKNIAVPKTNINIIEKAELNPSFLLNSFNNLILLDEGDKSASIKADANALEDGARIEIIGNKNSSLKLSFADIKVSLDSGNLTNLVATNTILNINSNERAIFTYSKENNVYIASKMTMLQNWD